MTFSDVKWTYISPAGDFQANGAKTGRYILGGEELTLNARGESVISYADYAVALVVFTFSMLSQALFVDFVAAISKNIKKSPPYHLDSFSNHLLPFGLKVKI